MARLSILRSVRRFCLDCQGGSARAVRACTDEACPLRAWRLPPEKKVDGAPTVATDTDHIAVGETSPQARAALRAVRRQCMQCAGGAQDVRSCRAHETCPLWTYRFGVRPVTYKQVRQRFFAPRPLLLFS